MPLLLAQRLKPRRFCRCQAEGSPTYEISTLTSTLAGVVATLVSLFLLRQRQVDRRKLREDQARAQARLITSWSDWHEAEFAAFAKLPLPAVFVNNASAAAVYDAFIDYRVPVDGRLFRVPIGPGRRVIPKFTLSTAKVR